MHTAVENSTRSQKCCPQLNSAKCGIVKLRSAQLMCMREQNTRDECTNLGPNDKSTQTRRHMLKTIASLEMAICNAKGTSTTLQNKCIGIFSNQGS